MRIQDKLKRFLGGNRTDGSVQQIVINSRSDGLSVTGLPAHITPDVASLPTFLLCGDRTRLPIRTTPTLISGHSSNRSQILLLQFASALMNGYTPFIISSANGNGSESLSVLQTMFSHDSIYRISDDTFSGYYQPFMGMNPSDIVDFFYKTVVSINPGLAGSSMLVNQYIMVCVSVFCGHSSTVQRLLGGQFHHSSLLEEIRLLAREGRLNPSEANRMISSAETAQSVSVPVLSTFHDVMYQMRRAFCTKPGCFPFNAGKLSEQRCVFVSIHNHPEIQGAQGVPCFEWYLAKLLELEFKTRPALSNQKIMLIFENLSSINLRCFLWAAVLPNCQLILSSLDFYSQLSDAPDLREQLISRMDRLFLFSHGNPVSASWCSELIGEHSVYKYTTTTRGARDWSEVLFPVRDTSESEVDEAWYKKEDIQALGDNGIVYCQSENVFRGKRKFCWFGFR